MASTPRSSDPYARGPISDKIKTLILRFTPIFLSLVQLKYGNDGASPYSTHPLAMGFGIACLLASCLAYLLRNVCLPDLSLPGFYGQVLEHAELLLGSLWLVSLVTLLLPSSWTTYSSAAYVFLSMGVGALMSSMLLKCKRSTSSSTGTAGGNLSMPGAVSIHQERQPPGLNSARTH